MLGVASKKQIARQVGVDRSTVRKVATGEHFAAAEDPDSSRYTRCSACGHLVIFPCRVCATLSFVRVRRKNTLSRLG